MSDIICVTASSICERPFLRQLKLIAEAGPKYIILREKHLDVYEYSSLAKNAIKECSGYGADIVLHYYWKAAIELGVDRIHLPLHILRELSDKEKNFFKLIGVSCHSVEDAAEAESLGASYITAGHIFATDCKKDLPPRGLDFLRKVCEAVEIPVYAIGGITPDNADEAFICGAAGACILSGFMKSDNPEDLLKSFNR